MPERRLLSFAAALVAAVAVTVSGPAAAQARPLTASTSSTVSAASHRPFPALAQVRKQTVVLTRNGRFGPYGPNPATSFVPGGQRVDWGGWRHAGSTLAKARARAVTTLRAKARASALGVAAAPAPVFIREDEPAGTRGSNDTFRTAQPLSIFGTGRGRRPAVTVLGRLAPAPAPSVEDIAPNTEPDDSNATAGDTGVSRARQGAHTTGTIGDNPPDPQNPAATDIDGYTVVLRPGELLNAAVKRTSGDLLPFMVLVDATGNLVTFGDDDFQGNSVLRYTARSGGTFYVLVGGYTDVDLATGAVTDTKGGYDVTVTARHGDRDLYRVALRAGDVLGVSVTDAAGYVSVFDAKGVEVHGSPQDASSIYPATSPLPGGGNAVTDHVVPRDGTYFVEVTQGDGTYEAQLEVYRYGGAARRQTQVIFLDTDGQRLNTNVVGGRGVTTLSPLRSFLGGWGLARRQEKALIARIKATVQENLDGDLRRSGLSRFVSVKVVTSLDGKDPFGRAGVTRVVVGGTIAESGVQTIGIAQSIDPGNFAREETALVLLDVLNGSPADYGDASLNSFLRKKSDRLAFVGHAVGNVISHEVGHLIGNWHTDNSNTRANLMDAGGQSFGLLFGVGKDGIGGTKDDRDVDFGVDAFIPQEGFTGTENTLARSTWGMSTR